jgi:hypothetical protein
MDLRDRRAVSSCDSFGADLRCAAASPLDLGLGGLVLGLSARFKKWSGGLEYMLMLHTV